MNYNQQRQSSQRNATETSNSPSQKSSSPTTVNGSFSPDPATSNGHDRRQSSITMSRGVLGTEQDHDVLTKEGGRRLQEFATATESPLFGERSDGGGPSSPSGKR